jgi:hypothetical protein
LGNPPNQKGEEWRLQGNENTVPSFVIPPVLGLQNLGGNDCRWRRCIVSYFGELDRSGAASTMLRTSLNPFFQLVS